MGEQRFAGEHGVGRRRPRFGKTGGRAYFEVFWVKI
jgi:hypothetical protein